MESSVILKKSAKNKQPEGGFQEVNRCQSAICHSTQQDWISKEDGQSKSQKAN